MRNNNLSEFIFIEHIPEPADIILIPGSTEIVLVAKALELYQKRYADCILLVVDIIKNFHINKLKLVFLQNIFMKMEFLVLLFVWIILLKIHNRMRNLARTAELIFHA